MTVLKGGGETMPIANVNGQQIHYSDSGGTGEALIFSHGFLMDLSMFNAQVEALSGEFRCIAWDERGFGRTPVKGPFSYWDSANDAVALLDYLQIDKAVFVGMSQGGFLSLRAALSHPQRVSGIVMIASESGAFSDDQIEAYTDLFGQWQRASTLGEMAHTVASLIIDDPGIASEWIEKWDAFDRLTLHEPLQTLLFRDDISDRLEEIICPVLVIHGENDQAIPIQAAEALRHRVPDCRGLLKIAGAAHAPNMTHPETVNAAISSFMHEL